MLVRALVDQNGHPIDHTNVNLLIDDLEKVVTTRETRPSGAAPKMPYSDAEATHRQGPVQSAKWPALRSKESWKHTIAYLNADVDGTEIGTKLQDAERVVGHANARRNEKSRKSRKWKGQHLSPFVSEEKKREVKRASGL